MVAIGSDCINHQQCRQCSISIQWWRGHTRLRNFCCVLLVWGACGAYDGACDALLSLWWANNNNKTRAIMHKSNKQLSRSAALSQQSPLYHYCWDHARDIWLATSSPQTLLSHLNHRLGDQSRPLVPGIPNTCTSKAGGSLYKSHLVFISNGLQMNISNIWMRPAVSTLE